MRLRRCGLSLAYFSDLIIAWLGFRTATDTSRIRRTDVPLSANDLGQVVHTDVPLSPSSVGQMAV